MKTIRLFVLILVLIFSASNTQAANSALTAWQGTYIFSGDAGRTVGGSYISYAIELTISPSGVCKVEEDGFQMLGRTSCTMTQNGSGIDILFKRYLKENMYEGGYKPGDRLFSLFPQSKGKALITNWGSIYPEDFVKGKKGVYFKRYQAK